MGLAQAHPNYRWFPIRITSSHTVYLPIYLFLIFFIHFFQISRELSVPPQDAHSKVKDWELGRQSQVAVAVPDLKKATQLYKDGLEALTALSWDAHSKSKDWKLGRQSQVAVAVPDLKKVMQLCRDVLGASGRMLTALSQDMQSKAKDGQLNRFAITAIFLCLGVDISDLEVSHAYILDVIIVQ